MHQQLYSQQVLNKTLEGKDFEEELQYLLLRRCKSDIMKRNISVARRLQRLKVSVTHT
jgi:hypothetical protein